MVVLPFHSHQEMQAPNMGKLEFLLYFSLFMLLLLKLLRKSSQEKKITPRLPPGPSKLPLIGNMHLLLRSLPHICLRDLSIKHGPIMHLKLGQVSTVVVSSSDVARQVMKTHDAAFASRPQLVAVKIMSYNCTDIAFAPYGDYWRQLRKICTLELLSTKRVQSFHSMRREEMLKLAHSAASRAGTAINLTVKAYDSAYGFTSRAAFGSKTKEQELFVLLMQESIEMTSGFDIADVYPSVKLLQAMSRTKSRLSKLQKKVDEILEGIINEHRSERTAGIGNSTRQDDLVDVLLRFQDEGDELPLATDNIKAVILDQLNYLKSVIKETLRLHPPLPLLLPRECGHVCKINGYDIPVESRILINAWAIGRDPKQWDDAESFIPERFLDSSIDFRGNDFKYIPFGGGRRICPGISFGLVNVELQLAMLLYHFDWSLPQGMKPEQLAMTETFGATVRRKDDLMAIPTVKIPVPII